jgi:hypothetical protein
MQHKARLGQKTTSKVTEFKPETDDNLSFVDASLRFHVADGPQPPPGDAAVAPTGEMGARSVASIDARASPANSMVRIHDVYM